MTLRTVISLVIIGGLFSASAWSKSTRAPARPMVYSAPTHEQAPPDFAGVLGGAIRTAAAVDTFELAFFTFDTYGPPDAQGWVSLDYTAQSDDYFHIADTTELNGGGSGTLLPLEGDQSLWCGTSPGSAPELCGWGALPGYGNGWDQRFVSGGFACDSVEISYKVQWHSEPVYDRTFVEFFDDASSTWMALPVNGGAGQYDDSGSLVEAFAFNPSNDTTLIRFVFESDGGWSDQDGLYDSDGAILIDSLTIRCYMGGVLTMTLFEDFEGEAPGSGATDDGWWSTQPPPSFGDFAALYNGSVVLQEDPCLINTTNFWGFFDDPAITNYSCHFPDAEPTQGAVRYGPVDGLYITNAIWSPKIALTGPGDDVVLSFRVYRDLTFSSLVAYEWAVRSWVDDDCPGPWKDYSSGYHYGAQRDWYQHTVPVGSLIDPAATHIQILLGVRDWCRQFCGIYGTVDCHSHAPLFDNVRVVRVDKTGPQFIVQDINLFQDTFAGDGSLTGTARADAAVDVLSASSSGILPGDSIAIGAYDPTIAIAGDPLSGVGPAVYTYVAVWPQNQPGKSGPDMEALETRSIGKRFPLVGSVVSYGVTWDVYRMDSVITGGIHVMPDRYCFDLNDAVFTPGDTICYFFRATNTSGHTSYFSREFDGQGQGFSTTSINVAFASPMEFTVLPAGGYNRGGSFLYVDGADDRGGDIPVQRFFDTAFENMGILELVDRYDVLSPSSIQGNTPASRVANIASQLTDVYQQIIWSSANLASGLIGDGTGDPSKANDFAMLKTFLGTHLDNPGLFITGDNNAEEWVSLLGASAVDLRSQYMSFDLVSGDHVSIGEVVTPELVAVSSSFTHESVPDRFIAYGGCPAINDFDILQPTGAAIKDLVAAATNNAYVISQATPNDESATARVMLAGFSIHEAGDVQPTFPYARAEILTDVLVWFQNVLPAPTGIDDRVPDVANYLGDNYPNPFNPTTTIRYGIERPGHVSLKIYNAAGQLVKTLVDNDQIPQSGGFRAEWRGDDNAGTPVASGVYFYRLVAGDFVQTRKMVLLK